MPWNFPFWQVFRFAAPALMAGNAGVLKHASNVPGCALVIAEVFRHAGFPEHLFETLLIGSAQVDAVIEHPKGMPAYDEELFGPVAAIIAVPDEAEAIRVANDSSFGLGAAVFTQDKAKGERLAAQELEAGCCFVNTFVRSDPRLPFGGVKASGYGRELSHYRIKEFVNIKTWKSPPMSTGVPRRRVR